MTDLSYIVEPLRPLAVPLDSLTLDPKNARLHKDADLGELAEELKTSGQDQAILVQKDGMFVRKGNGRVMAARKLGWTHIAAVVVDITDKDGVRRALVDNRLAERSSWDNANLLVALDYLEEEGVVLDAVGFDDDFMVELLSANEALVAAAALTDGDAGEDYEPSLDETAGADNTPREGAFKAALVFDTQADRAQWVQWTKSLRKRFPDEHSLGGCLLRHIRSQEE